MHNNQLKLAIAANYGGVEGYILDATRHKHMDFRQEAQIHKADFYEEYIAYDQHDCA